MNFGQNIQDRITLDQLQLYLLLFADDAILVSETPEGLEPTYITIAKNGT